MIQNIEEQCRVVFIADIYVKIFEDNVLNNFDKYFIQFFTDIYKISSNENERYSLVLKVTAEQLIFFIVFKYIRHRFVHDLYRTIFTQKI